MRVRTLDSGHDWTFGHGISNYLTQSEAIAQCVKTALMSFRTDWFLNIEHGVRWSNYLRKNPNLQEMEQELKRTILEVEGVIQITEFDINIGANNRKCKVVVAYIDQYNNLNKVDANVANNG